MQEISPQCIMIHLRPRVVSCVLGLSMAASAGCSGDPETRWGALSIMEIARETDGVSEGFDLDGLDSTADGADGCGIADYVNEAGVEGIDNAMARLMPILEQTEGAALESLIQQAISRGEVRRREQDTKPA